MHPKTLQILKTFEEIDRIPRCSKYEKKIALWLEDWARSRGFEVKTDLVNNLLIEVPATPGYENSPTLVLQGHMDMVCEKSKGSAHDFSRDPVKCVYDGDWMKGNGTSIGADNGIALAIALVLAQAGKAGEIEHPPLELLFTVDEETGLTGAMALEPGFFAGRALLNLDSEDEGVFTVGCAGGLNTRISLPVEYEPFDYEKGFGFFKLAVEGLKGGHSGVEIHRQRANAVRLLARVLEGVRDKPGEAGSGSGSGILRLVSLNGGSTHNSIPNFAEAFFALKRSELDRIKGLVSGFGKTFRAEYARSDPDIRLDLEEVEKGVIYEISETEVSEKEVPLDRVLTENSDLRLLGLLLGLPHGVYRMSDKIQGLVETSNNLALVRTGDDAVEVLSNQRSSVVSRLAEITGRIEAVAGLAGAELRCENGYPAWEPDLESDLLSRCKTAYTSVFGEEPAIEVVHAGLECGVIGSKCGLWGGKGNHGDCGGEDCDGDMEMISIGPTIKYPHSPDEMIYIPSIEKVWAFLEKLLKSYR
ncbi:TPA: aminoacyl-histidine dipeptidase [Methanosarcinaceae archaeon]|nr:aminoacyl-histidine dipeptidase [Methanosarcinaceae archaeon]